MKRITKILVTLTRRRVIRFEAAAKPKPKVTPDETPDVRETEHRPAAPK